MLFHTAYFLFGALTQLPECIKFSHRRVTAISIWGDWTIEYIHHIRKFGAMFRPWPWMHPPHFHIPYEFHVIQNIHMKSTSFVYTHVWCVLQFMLLQIMISIFNSMRCNIKMYMTLRNKIVYLMICMKLSLFYILKKKQLDWIARTNECMDERAMHNVLISSLLLQ